MTKATVEYEEDRLYCLQCKEQPEYFLELMAEHASDVTPDGTLLEPWAENNYVTGHKCPACGGQAEWGRDLNEQMEGASE